DLKHARCPGIGLQLALQPQDLDIDAAIENILVNSGGLQQVFPRQQPLRRFEKGQQQRILAFAQRDRRRIGIEQSSATPFELPALESISASFRITRSCNPFHFLPPQYGTEAGEQFPEAEWFYNIVVHPEFEADDAIDFVETMAGRDDNRNIRVGTNFPTDKFGRSTARQSRNGTVDQRSSAIDAGPAGIAPRCGRRQLDQKDRIAAMTTTPVEIVKVCHSALGDLDGVSLPEGSHAAGGFPTAGASNQASP